MGRPKGSRNISKDERTGVVELPLSDIFPEKERRKHRKLPSDKKTRFYPDTREPSSSIKWTEEEVCKLTNSLYEWIQDDKNVLIDMFFVKHRIYRALIVEWIEKFDFFREAFDVAVSWQKAAIVVNGLNRKHCPDITKLVLKNLYHDDFNKEEVYKAKAMAAEQSNLIPHQTLVLFNQGLKGMGEKSLEL